MTHQVTYEPARAARRFVEGLVGQVSDRCKQRRPTLRKQMHGRKLAVGGLVWLRSVERFGELRW
jgi:hypothetical protein